MKNIKQIITLLTITFLMSACSDYPTSGYIDLSKAKEQTGKELTLSNAQGFVFEIDKSVIEKITEINLKNEEINRVRDDYMFNPSFELENEESEKLKKDIETNREIIKNGITELNNAIEKWRRNLTKDKENTQQELIQLQSQKQNYDSYLIDAKSQLANIEAEIKSYKNNQANLLKDIVNETNRIIIQDKMAVKKIKQDWFRLSYREEDWNQRTNYRRWSKTGKQPRCESIEEEKTSRGRILAKNYPIKSYIHFDQIAEENKCYYISRPAKNVMLPEYDKFVIGKFQSYLQYSTNNLSKTKQQIDQELKNAKIIAENQTGIKSYYKLEKNIAKKEKHIKKLQKDLNNNISGESLLSKQEHVNQTNNAMAKMFNQAGRYRYTSNNQDPYYEISTLKTKLEHDINTMKYKLGDSIKLYLSSLFIYKNPIGQSIIKKTKFDKDGSFSGLDGSAGFVIPIVKFDVNKGKKTQSIGLRGFFDMTDKENSYADKPALLIDPENSKILNPSLVKEDEYEEIIAKKIIYYIKHKT